MVLPPWLPLDYYHLPGGEPKQLMIAVIGSGPKGLYTVGSCPILGGLST
jgi:hypothetical protein